MVDREPRGSHASRTLQHRHPARGTWDKPLTWVTTSLSTGKAQWTTSLWEPRAGETQGQSRGDGEQLGRCPGWD